MNFTADIAATLSAIGIGSAPKAPWPSDEIPVTKSALDELYCSGEVWGPAAVVDEARKASPAGTVATADSGAHRIVLLHVWQCDVPRGLLQSSTLCTMGYAVPLVIGRKIAEPGRR
jgi:acetolactate synthase I/II/III large subunit